MKNDEYRWLATKVRQLEKQIKALEKSQAVVTVDPKKEASPTAREFPKVEAVAPSEGTEPVCIPTVMTNVMLDPMREASPDAKADPKVEAAAQCKEARPEQPRRYEQLCNKLR